MTKDVQWQELYRDAMLEFEHTKLQKRIEAADAAIRLRVKELAKSNHDGGAAEERQAMADAQQNLGTLHRVELKGSTKLAAVSDNSSHREAL